DAGRDAGRECFAHVVLLGGSGAALSALHRSTSERGGAVDAVISDLQDPSGSTKASTPRSEARKTPTRTSRDTTASTSRPRTGGQHDSQRRSMPIQTTMSPTRTRITAVS